MASLRFIVIFSAITLKNSISLKFWEFTFGHFFQKIFTSRLNVSTAVYVLLITNIFFGSFKTLKKR